jgi:hypothetical protein
MLISEKYLNTFSENLLQHVENKIKNLKKIKLYKTNK